jgi:hypothetical protein
MINQLPELEAEDKRYDLHVGAEAPTSYNLTLIYPDWTPPPPLTPMAKEKVKANLAKLGIIF